MVLVEYSFRTSCIDMLRRMMHAPTSTSIASKAMSKPEHIPFQGACKCTCTERYLHAVVYV